MRFDILLGELIDAILAPIIAALRGLIAGIVAFIAELLTPVLVPIVTPIVEMVVAAYMLVLGAVFTLVWSLLAALGLASHARGVSLIGYWVAALSLMFLLIGGLQAVGVIPAMGTPLLTQPRTTAAILLTFLGFLIGAGAAMPPEERAAAREARKSRRAQKAQDAAEAPIKTAKRPEWSGLAVLLALIVGIGLGWAWFSKPSSPALSVPEALAPALPKCETQNRWRDKAANWLKNRGQDQGADLVAPRDCID